MRRMLRQKFRNRDQLGGITKGDIRRLARRGGVKRMSSDVYDHIRGCLKVFLEDIIGKATVYREHARRRTLSAMDVVYALKSSGRTLYGYN